MLEDSAPRSRTDEMISFDTGGGRFSDLRVKESPGDTCGRARKAERICLRLL